MQILYSSLHNLDMAQDRPVRKAIPADFNSYMDAYINLKLQKTTRHANIILSIQIARFFDVCLLSSLMFCIKVM